MTWFSTPVREYASKKLISVPEDASLREIEHVLDKHDVSAVAVVDPTGDTVGLVSMTDLLRVGKLAPAALGGPVKVADGDGHTARDIMVAPVVAVDDDAPVRYAAALMVGHHIHRVFVRRAGRIDAVISTRDVAQAVVFHHVDTPIERLLNREVASVEIGDSIALALDRLRERDVRGLVVLDGALPVGVFTQTEALKARALPHDLLESPVEQVMSYETICLDVKTPVYRAAGHLLALRVRRILAVEDRHLVGILTGWDVARVATTEQP